jgi:hypothetical protein
MRLESAPRASDRHAEVQRLCVPCGRTLPLSAFGKNTARPDGRQTQCRECRARLKRKDPNGRKRGRRIDSSNRRRTSPSSSTEVPSAVPLPTPSWKRSGISQEQLLRQREKFLDLEDHAKLVLKLSNNGCSRKYAEIVQASRVALSNIEARIAKDFPEGLIMDLLEDFEESQREVDWDDFG